MFLRDINNQIVNVGDVIAYASKPSYGPPKLTLAEVDTIKWFDQYAGGVPTGFQPWGIRVVPKRGGKYSRQVWITELNRIVKVNG